MNKKIEYNKRSIFTIIWVFIVINMAYADILSLMDSSSSIRQIMNGKALPPGGLIAGAILMETSILMILLCKILPYKIIKWLNIVISIINIAAVLAGGHGIYYYIFATIETLSMLIIIVLSLKWKEID